MRTEVQQLVSRLPDAGVEQATRLGLTLVPKLEREEWQRLVGHLARLARTSAEARQTVTAWLGDALAYGEVHYRGQIAECAKVTGFDAGTLRNAKMVCSRIPLSCRHDALSWTHHCEVGLVFSEPEEIENWLGLAEREKLSSAELRRRIRAAIAGARAKSETATTNVFALLRELRSIDRRLKRDASVWKNWSSVAADQALQELNGIVEFVDQLRTRALDAVPKPLDVDCN